MSAKVTGSDQRLSLAMPAQGQGWIRSGGAMVAATLGGGGGSASGDEFIGFADGDCGGSVAHTDLDIDEFDPITTGIGAGPADGFLKTIRAVGFASGTSTVVGNFRQNGIAASQLHFTAAGQAALIQWQTASSRWLVRLLSGGATVT